MFPISSRSSRFVVTLIAFAAFAVEGRAQDFRADISGQITDSGGAVVPGAIVTARQIATNAIYKTESGVGGEYALRNLEPGEYVISVEKVGFRKLSREGVVLQVASRSTINLSLEAG